MTTSALTHTTASNNKRRNEDDGKPRNIYFLIGLSGNDGCEAAIRWANANFIRTTDRVVFLLTIKPKITDGFAGLFRHRSPMLIDLDDQRLELTSFFSSTFILYLHVLSRSFFFSLDRYFLIFFLLR
jgi:hypothetical protein